jgi:hypothetical protein
MMPEELENRLSRNIFRSASSVVETRVPAIAGCPFHVASSARRTVTTTMQFLYAYLPADWARDSGAAIVIKTVNFIVSVLVIFFGRELSYDEVCFSPNDRAGFWREPCGDCHFYDRRVLWEY